MLPRSLITWATASMQPYPYFFAQSRHILVGVASLGHHWPCISQQQCMQPDIPRARSGTAVLKACWEVLEYTAHVKAERVYLLCSVLPGVQQWLALHDAGASACTLPQAWQHLAMDNAGVSACMLPPVWQPLAKGNAGSSACRHPDGASRRSRDARTWHARHSRPPGAPRRHQEGCNPSLAARRGGSANQQASCPCQQAWCAPRHACCVGYCLHVKCPAPCEVPQPQQR